MAEHVQLRSKNPVSLDLDGYTKASTEKALASGLAAQLEAAAVPLQEGTKADDDQWQAFDTRFSRARIIGAGENSHGISNWISIRHGLLRHLNKAHGFTILALEAGFAETLAIDSYVRGGPGTASAALEGLKQWPTDTEEMLAVIEQLKQHNAKAPASKQIRVFGVDMQESAAAFRSVAAYLALVSVDDARLFKAELSLLASDQALYEASADEKMRAKRLVRKHIATMATKRDAFSAVTGKEAWTLAEHSLVTLGQTIDMLLAPKRMGLVSVRARGI